MPPPPPPRSHQVASSPSEPGQSHTEWRAAPAQEEGQGTEWRTAPAPQESQGTEWRAAPAPQESQGTEWRAAREPEDQQEDLDLLNKGNEFVKDSFNEGTMYYRVWEEHLTNEHQASLGELLDNGTVTGSAGNKTFFGVY